MKRSACSCLIEYTVSTSRAVLAFCQEDAEHFIYEWDLSDYDAQGTRVPLAAKSRRGGVERAKSAPSAGSAAVVHGRSGYASMTLRRRLGRGPNVGAIRDF